MAEKKENYLTKEGYGEKRIELDKLLVEKDEIIEKLAAARANGDLSENADYDAARKAQAENESKIREISDLLENCKIIDQPKNSNKVVLGSKVTISANGSKETYTIVGTVEANPETHYISNECPLGKALMNASVGDVVEVKAKKTYKAKIVSIESRK